MSIYIGNDLENRLKILETENASLKMCNDYHQVIKAVTSCSTHNIYQQETDG